VRELLKNKLFNEVVRPERFELPASSSGGKRSIQLSYGRLTSVYIGSIGSSIGGGYPIAPRVPEANLGISPLQATSRSLAVHKSLLYETTIIRQGVIPRGSSSFGAKKCGNHRGRTLPNSSRRVSAISIPETNTPTPRICPEPLHHCYQAVSSAVQEQTPWPLPSRIANWHSSSRSPASSAV
jgi:hypothetical protein